jgi:DNA polymerase III subunit epsilon
MTWASLPVLAIDTETTGVDPFTDRIVSVAAVTVLPDGSTDGVWSTIIDPGVDIPDGATAVHGITTADAQANGVDPRVALDELGALLWRHMADHEGRAAVVMFNARFDWPLILAEAARHQVEFPCFAPILDPYLLDRICDRYRPGKRQLTMVADHYGVELAAEDAHGAVADARAAGRVLREMIVRYPGLAGQTLAQLWLTQVHGHEQDRQRFVDYMRRQKDPQFDTPAGWPVPVEVGRS